MADDNKPHLISCGILKKEITGEAVNRLEQGA
jgi:hypothetical protein